MGEELVKRERGLSPSVVRVGWVAAPAVVVSSGIVAEPAISNAVIPVAHAIGLTGDTLGAGAVGVSAGALALAANWASTARGDDSAGRVVGMLGLGAAAGTGLAVSLAEVGGSTTGGAVGLGFLGLLAGTGATFGIGCAASGKEDSSTRSMVNRTRTVGLASVSLGVTAAAADLAETFGAKPVSPHTLLEVAVGGLSAAAVCGAAAFAQHRRETRVSKGLGE